MLPVNITFELANPHFPVMSYCTLFPPCLFLSLYTWQPMSFFLLRCMCETCWCRSLLSPPLSFGFSGRGGQIWDLSLHLKKTQKPLRSAISSLVYLFYAGGFPLSLQIRYILFASECVFNTLYFPTPIFHAATNIATHHQKAFSEKDCQGYIYVNEMQCACHM